MRPQNGRQERACSECEGMEGRALLLPQGVPFNGRKGGEALRRRVRRGKGAGRAGGESHGQESMAAGIGAAPQFANTFTLHRIYASAHFPGRCSSPAGRIPSEHPKPEGDSPACRGMAGGVGGVWTAFGGFPRPRQGGDRVPVPLDGRRARSALAASRPGAGPPGSPASPLSPASSDRDGFSVPASLGKSRGTRARAKGSFAMWGDGGDSPRRLRRLPETKSSLSLPSRPRFWFPSVFLSFFIFPRPSPKGCLLFPSSFQASGLQNQTDAPSERRLSSSNVHSRSKLISQHWGIFRLAVN